MKINNDNTINQYENISEYEVSIMPKRRIFDEDKSIPGETVVCIDPGLQGGISVIQRSPYKNRFILLEYVPMPLCYVSANKCKKTLRIDDKEVLKVLQRFSKYTNKMVVEFQKGYKGQDADSAYQLGMYTEILKACAIFLEYKFCWVLPGVWKEGLDIKAKRHFNERYSKKYSEGFGKYVYNEVSKYIDDLGLEESFKTLDKYNNKYEISDGILESILIGVFALKKGLTYTIF